MGKRGRDNPPAGPGLGRTGYRQKLDVARDLHPVIEQPSALVRLLLSKRAWGNLSSPSVQEIAKAAVDDGLSHPHVIRLSKLGSSGKYPGKAHAELERALGNIPLTRSLSSLQLMLKTTRMTLQRADQAILYPHVLFSTLWHQYPDVFRQSLCGGSFSNITKFWDAMSSHPALSTHPMQEHPDFRSKVLPLALHGDGVPTQGVGKAWSRSAEIYSWQSCLAQGSTRLTNYLIFFFNKG